MNSPSFLVYCVLTLKLENVWPSFLKCRKYNVKFIMKENKFMHMKHFPTTAGTSRGLNYIRKNYAQIGTTAADTLLLTHAQLGKYCCVFRGYYFILLIKCESDPPIPLAEINYYCVKIQHAFQASYGNKEY